MAYIVRSTVKQARHGEIERVDRHFTVFGMSSVHAAVESVRKSDGGEVSVIGYTTQGPFGTVKTYCEPRQY